MRLPSLTLALGVVLTLASCGRKSDQPGPGDPAGPSGDPGGGGDNVVVADDTPPADQDVGDQTPGDAGGDAVRNDDLTGDTSPGDEGPVQVVTPSTQLCAAGSSVASSSYHGVVCLSPLGSGGPTSTSASYKLVPGPAHIVEAK